ncbi:hypothetical protein [Streptomyces sp. NPDC010273]|uniref:hypothetical protein n=1 Tax=Streptomyces sp. NPDC010273 TaxID=3364829 RepID=UPI0036ED8F14
MPAQQSSVMTSVPPESMGKAAGTFSAVRQLAGALGIAILAAVFAAHGTAQSPQDFADGFSAAMVAAAGLAILGTAGLLAPSRRATPPPAPAAAPTSAGTSATKGVRTG